MRSASSAVVCSLLTVFFLAAAPSGGQSPFLSIEAEKATCQRFIMADRPGWFQDGAWDATGTDLTLLDVTNDRLMRYRLVSQESEFLELSPMADRSSLQAADPQSDMQLGDFLPTNIAALPPNSPGDAAYILELGNGRLFYLDADGQALDHVVFTDTAQNSDRSANRVLYTYQWDRTATEGGSSAIVALADLTVEGAPGTAFVRIGDLSEPWKFEELRRVTDQVERSFYRAGETVLASLDDTAFALTFGESPTLEKFTPQSTIPTVLYSFPDDLRTRPSVTRWYTPDDYAKFMATLERHTTATSIAAWDGHVYVLARIVEGEGSAHFRLTKIEPEEDRFVRHFDLTGITDATNLTIIPGPRAVALVEKGPVEGFGIQDVRSILLIPTENFNRSVGSLCD